MSNCPKCDKQIGAFYFKQSCPYCGANLMYYDFDNRLKEDAAKAEKEWAAVGKLTDGIKKSAVGSLQAILRLISFFVPVVALLMPTFKFNESNLTLVSIIKQIISSSSDVFGNKALLLCLICFALAIVFALVNLVVSLFSYTKNGLVRNIVFSVAGIIAFAGIGIAAAAAGITICNFGGFYVAVILMIITVVLHFAVNKKFKAE